MKKRIGKISIGVLLSVITVLLAVNLIILPTQATKIVSQAEILSSLEELYDIVLSETRGAYGTVYYCDNNNGNDSHDGLSWGESFKTLAVAMATSHAKVGIGGHFTDRNTIYYMADAETATLTTLARKTDIIGVGSMDSDKRPKIIGDHTITEDTDFAGCRFYNIEFRGTGASAEVMHVKTQAGTEFHNCRFHGETSNTHGLKFEECQAFVVDDCMFYNLFATAAIEVIEDTDYIYSCMVTNNWFPYVSGIGIKWLETDSYNCWITDNYIYSVDICIDDDSDDVFVVNNVMITDDGTTSYGADNGWDLNLEKAAGNTISGSGSDLINDVPRIEESDFS